MDSSLVGAIFQSAGAGTAIIVVLLLLNIVSTKPYTKRVEDEADKWHAAWERSQEENAELRKAVSAQTARGDTAAEMATRLTDVLERLQERQRDGPVPPETRRRPRPGS